VELVRPFDGMVCRVNARCGADEPPGQRVPPDREWISAPEQEDPMSGEEPSQICGRDRAVLRAVAAGRCELRAGCEPELVVDGVRCADSAVAQRLIAAGLVVKPVGSAVARLTPAGRVAAGLISA
jgi:hypothetical protein